jgi:hypothetical protein
VVKLVRKWLAVKGTVAQFAMKAGFSGATVAKVREKAPLVSTKLGKFWYWSLQPPTQEQRNAILLGKN